MFSYPAYLHKKKSGVVGLFILLRFKWIIADHKRHVTNNGRIFLGAVAAIKHSKFMYGFSQIDSGAAGLSIE